MPVFEHISHYRNPRDEVFAWHERPGAFVRLSPPGHLALVSGPTDGTRVGSQLTLRVTHPLLAAFGPSVRRRGTAGPLGLTWQARHTELVPGVRFVDEQVRGPFRQWRHEHLFADGPGGSTVITDRVTWQLPARAPFGLDETLVDRELSAMFAYRERQLRDDLALHARLRGAGPAGGGATQGHHVLVAGASGLIGRQVCAALTTGGHRVTRLVRRAAAGSDEVEWRPGESPLDPGLLDGVDAVVNLAGHTIGGRFTEGNKRRILSSRLAVTDTLARAITAHGGDVALVQASAMGCYGPRRPGEVLTEDSSFGAGFLADVVRQWEAAAAPASSAGARTVLLRTGIVLSESGGALAPQVPLFRLGVGGRLTDADAWLSWVGLDDAARAYVHAIVRTDVEGPFNLVAPEPVTAGTFARTLADVLHRPAALPVPGFGPALVLGREGKDQLIDTDQRVSSAALSASGFGFAQPKLTGALRHVLLR